MDEGSMPKAEYDKVINEDEGLTAKMYALREERDKLREKHNLAWIVNPDGSKYPIDTTKFKTGLNKIGEQK